ncbi:hypothetical protein Taro_050205 [Colocasia esculenta]|uniref:Terpene synthase N-terminal domain-containing protein n=1 Tax=Colocasia esculenta TaxID=4460 RepID=A0A843XDG3_COLES|nr:hypothetical protein [Colocasia esculenta]
MLPLIVGRTPHCCRNRRWEMKVFIGPSGRKELSRGSARSVRRESQHTRRDVTANRVEDDGSHQLEAMVAAVAVLPRPSPAAVTPLSRVRTALSPPADFLAAANPPGMPPFSASIADSDLMVLSSLGGSVHWGARTLLPGGCRGDAISNKPAGVPAAATFRQGSDALTSCSAVKVSVNNDVHRSRGMSVIHLPERAPQVDEDDEEFFVDVDRTTRRISKIKAMLESIGDGEISISAYDTAWVALVPDIHGSHGPQFPSSLQWIKENQLPDGSWGDRDFFISYDRLLNTLACVIALKTWSVCPDRCQRGITFLWGNIHRLQEEDEDHMPIGFEVAFPSLVEIARSLNLDVPYDAPTLRGIYAKRAFKLERIPTDVMHQVPTTLLHSLEGMPTLDWKKLLRLQCADGSFLFSPASTAFSLMQTRDSNCLAYLEKTVRRFNGGGDNQSANAFSHWTEDGIGWARNSRVQDVDDTSMGFRLLRLHGYDVSSEVFRRFQKDGEFFCFAGQSNQAITGIYNLNRASQVSFPGEKILEQARTFSHGFLRKKQAHNELSDKWIITKDLPGEVGYALNFSWYASLPRVETRLYIEQYGGDRDVWIGKTLYRMPYVNNDDYLDLAKSDFTRCQALHQLELLGLQRWYGEYDLDWYGVSRRSLLRSYFLASASIFEPERAAERLGWARTAVLAEAVSAHLSGSGGDGLLNEMKKAVCAQEDVNVTISTMATTLRVLSTAEREDDGRNNGPPRQGRKRTGMGLVGALLHTLDRLALDAAASLSPGGAHVAATQRHILQHLRLAWEDWLLAWREDDEDSHVSRWWPGGAENDETGLLLVRSVELCAGRTDLEDSLLLDAPQDARNQYAQPAHLVSRLCRKLRHFHQHNLLMAEGDRNNSIGKGDAGEVESQLGIESDMQELLQCVLRNPSGVSHGTLQTFLTVAKSFYYIANCPPSTLENHIAVVLFEETV